MTKQFINTSLLESTMFLKGFKNRSMLAEAIGVTPATISNLLNGVHQPSGALINAIYKQLDLTPKEMTDIFFGEVE